MISAGRIEMVVLHAFDCFSAIARSVMISAKPSEQQLLFQIGFSAIARSVMISAQDARCRQVHIVTVSVL